MQSAVVVADEDEPLRRLLKYTLTRAGFDVAECSTYDRLVQDVSRRHPDLVVLDGGSGLGAGLQVLRALRSAGEVAPVVVLTTDSTNEVVDAAIKAGAESCIPKPFSPRRLVAELQATLRRRSARTAK